MQTRPYREEMLKYIYIQQSSFGTRVPGRAAFVQVDKYNMASIILLSIHSCTVYLPTLDDYYYDTYYNTFYILNSNVRSDDAKPRCVLSVVELHSYYYYIICCSSAVLVSLKYSYIYIYIHATASTKDFFSIFFPDIHVLRKTPIIPRGGRMELLNGGDG